MKKEEIKNNIKKLEAVRNNLQKRISNSLSEDALNDLQANIDELQSAIALLNDIKDNAMSSEENLDEAVRTQIAEVFERLKRIEEKGGEPDVENRVKKVVNDVKFVNGFFDVVKNSNTAKAFKENFKGLVVKNGINSDNFNDFLPPFIINDIRDKFVGRRHRLLELVDWTGLPCFKALWETNDEIANIHTPGSQKTEQTLAFEPIEIRPSLVYKYIKIDRLMEKESEASGSALLRYIVNELLDRLLYTIEQYILTGAGTSFLKPKEVTMQAGIYDALAYMQDVDNAVAIMSPAKYLEIKTGVTTLNNRLATHEDVLSYLGVEEVIFNRVVYTPSGGTWGGIWYLRPQDYKLVGDTRPDEFTDFNLAYNQREYLTEILIGGGCVVPGNFVTLISE